MQCWGRTRPDSCVRTTTYSRQSYNAPPFLHGERLNLRRRWTPRMNNNRQTRGCPDCHTAFTRYRLDMSRSIKYASVARGWAQSGTIDRDLLPLLDPPDADSMTEALASGLLPTFGISKRTGEIIPLPPSTWRMEVGGFSQSLWAIRGDDVRSGHDSDPCLPVVTRADLARALQATSIPPDPSELPVGWKPATPIRPTSVAFSQYRGPWHMDARLRRGVQVQWAPREAGRSHPRSPGKTKLHHATGRACL